METSLVSAHDTDPKKLWDAGPKWSEEEAVVLRDVPESGQEVTAAPKVPRSSVPVNRPVIIAHTTVFGLFFFFWKEVFFSCARDY